MSFNIRKAEKQDLPAVFELLTEFAIFQQTPEKLTITLDQLYRDREWFNCLVPETESGVIVGFASCFFTYHSWSGRAMYLDDLYVTEAYRAGGIGKQLLLYIIEMARQEQCKKVRWLVSKWNTNAIDFYRQMGAVFEKTEIICDLVLG